MAAPDQLLFSYGTLQHHLERGELKRVKDAPIFKRPVYLSYPSHLATSDVTETALAGLRLLGKTWSGSGATSPLAGERTIPIALSA